MLDGHMADCMLGCFKASSELQSPSSFSWDSMTLWHRTGLLDPLDQAFLKVSLHDFSSPKELNLSRTNYVSAPAGNHAGSILLRHDRNSGCTGFRVPAGVI